MKLLLEKQFNSNNHNSHTTWVDVLKLTSRTASNIIIWCVVNSSDTLASITLDEGK